VMLAALNASFLGKQESRGRKLLNFASLDPCFRGGDKTGDRL
jgi:hypothetical protein